MRLFSAATIDKAKKKRIGFGQADEKDEQEKKD